MRSAARLEPGDTPTDALGRVLAARPRLLVLDNFEHLIDAATLLAELLDERSAATSCW